ncbi:MAG: hypothetical protein ACLFTK_00220 [Anaerolineales bacterium]
MPPTVISFTSDRESILLTEAEAGTEDMTLAWQTANLTENMRIQLYAYEISAWVLLNDDPEADPLPPDGEFEITIQHPLNFNSPTYRLVILDDNEVVYSESVLTLDWETGSTLLQPSIARFDVSPLSIEANALAYEGEAITVSWEIENRAPQTNLRFEQILADGTTASVESPRQALWISSEGSGTAQAQLEPGADTIALRLRLVDVITGDVLDEAGEQVTVTGTLATPTPRPTEPPRPTAEVAQQSAPEEPAAEQPPAEQPPAETGGLPAPVAGAGASGGFELGGHIATFGNLDIARAAGMTWVKKQVRWSLGEGTGNAAGIINSARGNGFRVLLGVVGNTNEMGDYDAYIAAFADYLGQVAALGPEAIEVWNEPNIEREWPRGTINGATYTRMLAAAYNAIKAANPNVMVISGAPAPTGFFGGGCGAGGCDDNVFLRQMANAGAAQYMDCVGAHYNEGIIGPDQNSGDPRGGHYSRYFGAMLNLYYNTFGGARRVCWTELGYLTPEGYGPLPGNFAWAQNTTLGQQAEWLGRAAALSRQSGRVRLMIVWNVDFQVYDNDPQAGYAIRRADGSCPACGALAGAMQ